MTRDLLWSAIEAAGGALLSFASAFVVASIIGPAELGVGTAALTLHIVLWVVVNALFADALVQRITLEPGMEEAAFWASSAVGVLAMLIQAGAGWGLVALMGDPRLLPMALVLALPLPIVGAAGVRQGMLTRAGAYRHLALRTLLGQGLGTAAGIYLALRGTGGWAIVGQQAIGSLVGALVLLAGKRPPSLAWDWRTSRMLLVTGVPLAASTLVVIGRYRLFALLIGGTLGPIALGQVHVAFRLVETAREQTFTALWRLMLPALSAYQHDRPGMLDAVDQLLRWSSRITMPLCVALAGLLPWLVPALLGSAWAEAGWTAEPLVAVMALLALVFPSGVALVAFGGASQALRSNLWGLILCGFGVWLLHPATAEEAVMVWCGGQAAVSAYALWLNSRRLRVGWLRPLRAGLPAAAMAVAALACLAGAVTLYRSLLSS